MKSKIFAVIKLVAASAIMVLSAGFVGGFIARVIIEAVSFGYNLL